MTDDCHHDDSTELSALVPLRSHVTSRIKLITRKIIAEWWKFYADNTSQNKMKVIIIGLNPI
jgi:hypothetical protein